MRRVVLPLLLILFFLAFAAPAQAERRVALVIGNGAYKDAPLKNPENDARDMAAMLKRHGFEVDLLVDASKAKIVESVRAFGLKLRQGGVGLFFFAGHGLQIKGENYLVPVGAQVATEAEVEFECVEANRVLRQMEDAKNELNIVILDACRNNPFARSFRSTDRGLAQMSAPTGSLVAFATAPGSVAADGTGRNGVYTENLLKHMAMPGVPISQVLMRVRNDVLKASGKKQTPWESSSLTGDFYFAGGTQVSSLGPSGPSVQSSPPPVAPAPKLPQPGQGGVRFDDIEAQGQAQAKAEAEAKAKWAAWQKDMAAAVGKAQALEKNASLAAAQKAQAWQRVGEAYADKNPYSDEDAKLRARVQAQQAYWATEARKQTEAATAAQAKQQLALAPVPKRDPVEARMQAEALAAAQAKQQLALAPAPKQAPGTAPASGSPGQTWRDPVTGMEFVWVPGGSFEMGCGSWTSECYDIEKPVHSVRLFGFWLGKFEVTQGQWQRVMGDNPSNFKKGDNYPVEQVSWNDVKEFISRLNVMDSAKFRLPTEAEWEYAARSGGRPEKYAGGDDFDRVAWHKSNSGDSTHAVGTKAPNGLGLYDMSGNVWEWVEDVKTTYPSGPQDNPVVTVGGWYRVYRGGGWNSEPRHVRSAHRYFYTPDLWYIALGFRLVMTN